MGVLFLILSALFSYLTLTYLVTLDQCECSQYSFYECRNLYPPRCFWNYNTKSCVIALCRNQDIATCSALSYCYWAGDISECQIRPKACDQFIFDKVSLLECKLVGCGLDSLFRNCIDLHECSQYDVDKCPISCYQANGKCLENICDNYVEEGLCKNCPKYYQFTNQKCTQLACEEAKDKETCILLQQIGGKYCSWQDAVCLGFSPHSECKAIKSEAACLRMEKCIFRNVTCMNRICRNLPMSLCQEPSVSLVNQEVQICSLFQSQCLNGTWLDFNERTCFKQGSNFHWKNERCLMCNETSSSSSDYLMISHLSAIDKCACSDLPYPDCKHNYALREGCFWDETRCNEMSCWQFTDEGECGMHDRCYWGGDKTRCKERKKECSQIELDKYSSENCERFRDSKVHICVKDPKNETSCKSLGSCSDYDQFSCPTKCYLGNKQCLEFECQNFLSEKECMGEHCSGLYYFDGQCKPKVCSNFTQDCKGQNLKNGNICILNERKECVEMRVDQNCEVLKEQRQCDGAVKGCIFVDGKCRNKKCEDFPDQFCRQPTLYKLGGSWQLCERFSGRCRTLSEQNLTDSNCSRLTNFTHVWNRETKNCIKCVRERQLPNTTLADWAALIPILIEVALYI